MSEIIIKPQPGPQEQFMASTADIVIYGGAAFGGKTFGILMECARPMGRMGFDAVIFRRTYPQITASGGLWDTSMELYSKLGGKPKNGDLSWVWPSGHRVMFRHLQHEKDKQSWQGSAIPLLGFDELTHFTKGQFFYLLSRNRMYAGAPGRPYVRATCNPDSNSWVAEFLNWWIDQSSGLPIPDRAGKVRWMAREGDTIVWGNSREELTEKGYKLPRSVTFIPAKMSDNKLGTARDPEYEGNLLALSLIEREQLLYGNWKVKAVGGMIFKRHWFPVIDKCNAIGRIVRYWDRAATEKSPQNTDPDWTVGVKTIKTDDGYVVLDVVRLRGNAGEVLATIKQTAQMDGDDVEQWLEEDPGQAGKAEAVMYLREMEGKNVRFRRPSGSKVKRALPASAQAEKGRVKLLRGPWNDAFLSELQDFCDYDNLPKEERPKDKPHDDQVDGFSGSMNELMMASEPRIR